MIFLKGLAFTSSQSGPQERMLRPNPGGLACYLLLSAAMCCYLCVLLPMTAYLLLPVALCCALLLSCYLLPTLLPRWAKRCGPR